MTPPPDSSPADPAIAVVTDAHGPSRATRGHGWILGVFALIYLGLSIPNLDRFPTVHEDEPYIAATAQSLATRGTWGNPLFTGFYGAEQHIFLHPPLLPFVQAATFRVAGPSVQSMRVPGVLAGLVLLLLTLHLAYRLRGTAGAMAAGVLLLGFRLTAGWNETSGVPLLDIARVARPDVFVPAFALAALHIFDIASSRADRPWLWLATGALVGGATLAHLYGAFYGIAFLLILTLRPGPRLGRARAALLLAAGAAAVLTPLLLWILANLQDFSGQQRLLSSRYAAFDPRFLAQNLLAEVQRYRTLLPVDLTFGTVLARPTLWIGLPCGLLAFAMLLRRAISDRPSLAFAISITLLTNAVLFALLLQVKTYNYVIAFWPLAVLVLAVAAVDVWRAGKLGLRMVFGVALTVVFAEGILGIAQWQTRARTVTPYAEFTQRIAAQLPAGARLLGLQRYWLGLHEFRYTSWLLPVWLSDARFTDNVLTLDAAIERVAPDFILIDPAMAAWFASISSPSHTDHARFLEWQAYQLRHNATLVGAVTDPAYGEMRILRIN